MNEYKKDLNLDQMRELVSDYALDNLNEYESEVFEYNLKKYPGLNEEITEIKSIFSKVDKESIIDEIDKRTVNLSYKVQSRIQKKNSKKLIKNNLYKLVAPLLGLLVIFVLATNIDFNDKSADYDELELIKSNEMVIIGENHLNEIVKYDFYLRDFEVNNYLKTDNKEVINGFIYNSSNIAVEEIIYGLNEEDFEDFYEELKNEEINI